MVPLVNSEMVAYLSFSVNIVTTGLLGGKLRVSTWVVFVVYNMLKSRTHVVSVVQRR